MTDLGIAIAESTRRGATVTDDEAAALADIQAQYGPLGTVPAALGGHIRLRNIIEPEASFEVERLTSILDGSRADIRERMRLLLARPEFAYPGRLEHDDYRELVLRWAQTLADEGLGLLSYPKPHGSADPGSFVAAFAMIGHHDLSLLTKFGVQFGLFGGSIARLGSARHHDEYLPAVGSLALPGCFAMTETGHGLIEAGTEPAEAFIEVQTHAATAAAGHVEPPSKHLPPQSGESMTKLFAGPSTSSGHSMDCRPFRPTSGGSRSMDASAGPVHG